MSFIRFLKDKLIYVSLNIINVSFMIFVLFLFKVNASIVFLFCGIFITGLLIPLVCEYYQKNIYYTELLENIKTIEKKNYINTFIEKKNFIESHILSYVIEEIANSSTNQINIYKNFQQEYKDYIESWVHEIKLPISTITLTLENVQNNKIKSSIEEELTLLNNYIEQVLYYAKMSKIEIDYNIKTISIDEVVKNSIKNTSKILVKNNVKIVILNTNNIVNTDSKWIEFILGQIIQNSIKYMDNEKQINEIKFECEVEFDKVILNITDNGIGIPKSNINKVFLKGFTGENGSYNNKSTGIGLYICKTLCEKMNLKIEIDSKIKEYTKVRIIFPIKDLL